MPLYNLDNTSLESLIKIVNPLGASDFTQKSEITDRNPTLTPDEIAILKNIKVADVEFSESYKDTSTSCNYPVVDLRDKNDRLNKKVSVSNRMSITNTELRAEKLKQLLTEAKAINPEQSVFDAIDDFYRSPQNSTGIAAWIQVMMTQPSINPLTYQLLIQRLSDAAHSGRTFDHNNIKDCDEINGWFKLFQKLDMSITNVKESAEYLKSNQFESEANDMTTFVKTVNELLNSYTNGKMKYEQFQKNCSAEILKIQKSPVMKYERSRIALIILGNLLITVFSLGIANLVNKCRFNKVAFFTTDPRPGFQKAKSAIRSIPSLPAKC